ncbi:hypothetical protein MNAN1_000866 [Malassezia nana]|uniref:Transcription initiation factor TFIID subunit 8 n=1 Tax=Malassezia nana TaxID=180528 RepID=A0AAF0J2Q3_9BASI|nr:hypothetical protein MNAN1_000866 [Malassezia nana]
MAGVSTCSPVGADVLGHDAQKAVRALVVRIARRVGFDGAREQALSHMEHLVEDFMETLLQSCARLSEVANRSHPTLYDMIHTFELLGLSIPELRAYSKETRDGALLRAQIPTTSVHSEQAPWEHPTDAFLPSDDEQDTDVSTWKTLMHDIVPDHLPPQPPRHCWMFTPVYATEVLSEMPALQLVNRKLENARLVESSLRQLIKNTDTAAPVKPWIPLEPAPPLADVVEDEGDMSVISVDAPPQGEPMTTDVPTGAPDASQSEAGASATLEELGRRRGVLPRAVNYKVSWYASHASTDNKLPTANLYTARLRGNMDETVRRAWRYIV